MGQSWTFSGIGTSGAGDEGKWNIRSVTTAFERYHALSGCLKTSRNAVSKIQGPSFIKI
jgi:hypothetical protein